MIVREDDPFAGLRFQLEIVAEQTGAVRGAMVGLCGGSLAVRWGGPARPDLPVRMRIAGAHRGAAVLEDLHRVDVVMRAERARTARARLRRHARGPRRHARHGEVVARRIADHPADAGFRLGDDQPAAIDRVMADRRLERREVVVEDEGVRVVGIDGAVGAAVARAEIAWRVVRRRRGRRGPLRLACPGALVAMRRDQHPFAGERVEAAMGDVWMGA